MRAAIVFADTSDDVRPSWLCPPRDYRFAMRFSATAVAFDENSIFNRCTYLLAGKLYRPDTFVPFISHRCSGEFDTVFEFITARDEKPF